MRQSYDKVILGKEIQIGKLIKDFNAYEENLQ